MYRYGKISVTGTCGRDLFDTMQHAKEDFGSTGIPNIIVSFNDSLMVPVKLGGVVTDYPKEIWDNMFSNEKFSIQEKNKILRDYASQYAEDNKPSDIDFENMGNLNIIHTYGNITIQNNSEPLSVTIQHAQEDFVNTEIPNIIVAVDDSLMVPIKALGVAIDYPKGFLDSMFSIGTLTIQDKNKALSAYASKYAVDNEESDIAKSMKITL